MHWFGLKEAHGDSTEGLSRVTGAPEREGPYTTIPPLVVACDARLHSDIWGKE